MSIVDSRYQQVNAMSASVSAGTDADAEGRRHRRAD